MALITVKVRVWFRNKIWCKSLHQFLKILRWWKKHFCSGISCPEHHYYWFEIAHPHSDLILSPGFQWFLIIGNSKGIIFLSCQNTSLGFFKKRSSPLPISIAMKKKLNIDNGTLLLLPETAVLSTTQTL